MLQLEEQKILRKVEMTKKKAMQILAIKQQEREMNMEIKLRMMNQNEDMEQRKEQLRVEKELERKRMIENKTNVFNQKKKGYEEVKALK